MPSLISTMGSHVERKNLQQKRCPHKLPRLKGHLHTFDPKIFINAIVLIVFLKLQSLMK